jgi:exodeoxyribonuclease V beta subunit
VLNHIKQGRKQAAMFPARLDDDSEPVRTIDLASPVENARKWEFAPLNASGGDIARMKKFEQRTKVDGKDIVSPNCRKGMSDRDVQAEERRLFYVAMTRAMHKVICYWSPTGQHTPKDPFITSIVRASGAARVPISGDELRIALEKIVEKSLGTIEAIDISAKQTPRSRFVSVEADTKDGEGEEVEVARFGRNADSVTLFGFGRWSYSSVTKRLKRQSVLGKTDREQPSIPGVSDESNVEDDDVSVLVPKLAWDGLPAGAGFGNDVHHVLDIIDPATADLATELRSAIDDTFLAGEDGLDRGRLVAALTENLATPLAHAFDGLSMVDLGRGHRLSEMKFDFPLPADKSVPVHHIVRLATKHGNLPDGVREFFERLSDSIPATNQIAGYMNGSIDAVFRIDGETPKFVVCDYKTNKLHKDDDPDPIRCYERASMQETMLSDGYFFQAMIYSVALQRYLRQRLPGYDYDKHFGGVSYLFLRGLNGEIGTDGHQCGHYFWQPGRALIDALDDLFSETTKVDK